MQPLIQFSKLSTLMHYNLFIKKGNTEAGRMCAFQGFPFQCCLEFAFSPVNAISFSLKNTNLASCNK